jgi:hypothetical protein
MPNVATAVSEEISRPSRKEVRRPLDPTKVPRHCIAGALHRSNVKWRSARVSSPCGKGPDAPHLVSALSTAIRPAACRQRTRLPRERRGPSAKDFGKLLRESAQSIYTRTREVTSSLAEQHLRREALRGIGACQAAEKLNARR